MADERGKRKLAAILAANVAGYSRLMREHEAGTLALPNNIEHWSMITLRDKLIKPACSRCAESAPSASTRTSISAAPSPPSPARC